MEILLTELAVQLPTEIDNIRYNDCCKSLQFNNGFEVLISTGTECVHETDLTLLLDTTIRTPERSLTSSNLDNLIGDEYPERSIKTINGCDAIIIPVLFKNITDTDIIILKGPDTPDIIKEVQEYMQGYSKLSDFIDYIAEECFMFRISRNKKSAQTIL